MHQQPQNLPPYSTPLNSRRHPERLALRKNSNIVGFGLFLIDALSYGIMFLLYFWVGNFLPSQFVNRNWTMIYDIISLITYTLSFLIPCVAMIRFIRIPTHIALPMKRPAFPMVICGIFCCLGVSVLGGYLAEMTSTAVKTLFGYQPTMPDLSPPGGGLSFAIYLINVVALPAFLEEMVFRGVVMQSLRRFGDGFALVVSTVLFAMAHGNLVQGPNTLVVGIAIGFFVMRSGSLWTGIIIHFVNNGLAVAIDMGLRYIDAIKGLDSILNSAYFIIYYVCAVFAFLFMLNRYPGILWLSPSRSIFSTGKRVLWFSTTIGIIFFTAFTIYITSRYFKAV